MDPWRHFAEKVAIGPATWHDLRPLMRLEKACFEGDSWPWYDLLAALTFPETVRLKAEWRGAIVGFVIGDRRPRQNLGWIASIGVDPAYRRRGLGRRLLYAGEAALGTPRVRLTLRRSNDGALELYLRTGYVQIDLWPKYYRDGEDALVMEKTRGTSDP